MSYYSDLYSDVISHVNSKFELTWITKSLSIAGNVCHVFYTDEEHDDISFSKFFLQKVTMAKYSPSSSFYHLFA